MRRLFYVALGATVGVAAVRRVSSAAAKWTPEGLAEQAGGIGGKVAERWSIVRESAASREQELRSALGLDAQGGLNHQDGLDDRENPAA